MSVNAYIENRNYYLDARVASGKAKTPVFCVELDEDGNLPSEWAHLDGWRIDNSEWFARIELPWKYEVCSICNGRGKHVNPSIDAGGLGYDDFAEDPDFAEEYMSGAYDVSCYHCGGLRVEPVVDEALVDKKLLDAYYRDLADEAAYYRECAMERAMGA